TRKIYLDGVERAKKAEADFKGLSANFPKQVEEVQTKANELIAATRATFVGDTDKYRKDMQAASDQVNQKRIELEDAVAKATGLGNQLKRAEERNDTRIDAFQGDKPHGKIIGKHQNIVDINLGSADNVHTGLTFSVQPSDTPERGMTSRMKPRLDAK